MDSKNYAEVLIDGSVYTLAGAEEKSYFQKVAAYINDKIEQMRAQPGFTKQSDNYQTVMVELNIADDYFKAVDRLGTMERQKADMEREMYSLKHELVSTQMKLEAALRSLEDLQKQQFAAASLEASAFSKTEETLHQEETLQAEEKQESQEAKEERERKENQEKEAAVAAAISAAHSAGFVPPASHIPSSYKGGHGTRKGRH